MSALRYRSSSHPEWKQVRCEDGLLMTTLGARWNLKRCDVRRDSKITSKWLQPGTPDAAFTVARLSDVGLLSPPDNAPPQRQSAPHITGELLRPSARNPVEAGNSPLRFSLAFDFFPFLRLPAVTTKSMSSCDVEHSASKFAPLGIVIELNARSARLQGSLT